jgi:hypothetical protein
MLGVVSHLLKRSGMVSNLLKRWRDDFVTVKRQRGGFGAFRKETGCHPASSRPTSSTGFTILKFCFQIVLNHFALIRNEIVLINSTEDSPPW